MSTLSVSPPRFEMGSAETLILGYDTTPFLQANGLAGPPTGPSATLTDVATGQAYPTGIGAAPTTSGNVIRVQVTALQPGHRYRLVVTFTVGGNTASAEQELDCVF